MPLIKDRIHQFEKEDDKIKEEKVKNDASKEDTSAKENNDKKEETKKFAMKIANKFKKKK